MGDRCVIVSADTTSGNKGRKIGIYLHNDGYKSRVEEFLEECKKRKVRGVISDPNYSWARICQTCADIISADMAASNERFNYKDPPSPFEVGIGIGIVTNLDCQNFNNGVYYIDNDFNIVKHTDGSELS